MGHLPLFAEIEKPEEATLMYGVGRLICAWGALEQGLEQKICALREAAGDVRNTSMRTKPGMGRLIAELRATVSMRDRRDVSALSQIADIERDIQRIDRFRGLIVSGFGAPEPGGFPCRDQKNNEMHVSMEQLDNEIGQLEKYQRSVDGSVTFYPLFPIPRRLDLPGSTRDDAVQHFLKTKQNRAE